MIDQADIFVRGGTGGDGASSFHRGPYTPRGGPDGGDGGRGGDVILTVDPSLNTLMHFRRQRRYIAENGAPGGNNKRMGRRGKTLYIKVPPGTLVLNDRGEMVADLINPGDEFIAAKGGRGGRGNLRFVSPTNRAPRMAEKGAPGTEAHFTLELKLLADVGLVGMPNAGKSTLLGHVSAARPKTAAYPFTTLRPKLGVVSFDDGTSFVMADIPGLIEGAHRGVGLGHQFLRHIERTRVLIFVIDASGWEGREPEQDFFTLKKELEKFHPGLLDLPRIIALNKVDLPDARERMAALKQALADEGRHILAISGITGEGVDKLLGTVRELLERAPDTAASIGAPPPARRVYAPEKELFTVEAKQGEEGAFLVISPTVERWLAMTDINNEEALAYLQRRLQRINLDEALRQAGAKTGDIVYVGEHEFTFSDPEES